MSRLVFDYISFVARNTRELTKGLNGYTLEDYAVYKFIETPGGWDNRGLLVVMRKLAKRDGEEDDR